MPGQTVYDFESLADSSNNPTPDSNYFLPGSVVSICDSPAFSRVAAEDFESNSDGLGCARGLRSAFALEAVVALVVYGIWHLWHLKHFAH